MEGVADLHPLPMFGDGVIRPRLADSNADQGQSDADALVAGVDALAARFRASCDDPGVSR